MNEQTAKYVDKHGTALRPASIRLEQDLYEWIRGQAVINRRSVGQQIIHMVEIAKRQLDAEPVDIQSGR